jgi:predicted nucleic acid-binding protein
MIYIDTSALVKLVATESESAALIDWLNSRLDEPLVTSIVGRIELTRAAARIGDAAVVAAQRLAATVDTLVLSDSIASQAAILSPTTLRTLDAIHLATAYEYRQRLSAFCVYDQRLVEAARNHALPVTSPGTE